MRLLTSPVIPKGLLYVNCSVASPMIWFCYANILSSLTVNVKVGDSSQVVFLSDNQI